MSASMNRVILLGRLACEPDLRVTQSAKAVCKFRIAVDRNFKKDGKQEADFIPIVTFGSLAENCSRYLAKGRLVAVDGRIQTGSYEKQDGTKAYTTDVIASDVQFLGGGNNNGNSGNQEPTEGNQQSPIDGIHQVDNNDDLPF